jgi:hypothetical protein
MNSGPLVWPKYTRMGAGIWYANLTSTGGDFVMFWGVRREVQILGALYRLIRSMLS